ncbi:MAG: hypothetical protein IKP78_05430 [Ruminococcus sp.]|nr:hypothetical protein [Ruminococcus sp.]
MKIEIRKEMYDDKHYGVYFLKGDEKAGFSFIVTGFDEELESLLYHFEIKSVNGNVWFVFPNSTNYDSIVIAAERHIMKYGLEQEYLEYRMHTADLSEYWDTAKIENYLSRFRYLRNSAHKFSMTKPYLVVWCRKATSRALQDIYNSEQTNVIYIYTDTESIGHKRVKAVLNGLEELLQTKIEEKTYN